MRPAIGALAAQQSRRFACVTKSTANMSRRSPASSAAGCRAKRTIFALPSLAPWDARSATNSRFLSAGYITANYIAMVMKHPGGRAPVSTLCRSPSNFGGDRGQSNACLAVEPDRFFGRSANWIPLSVSTISTPVRHGGDKGLQEGARGLGLAFSTSRATANFEARSIATKR